MKKISKKMLALLLTMVMAFAVTACGSKNEADTASSNTASEDEAASGDAAASSDGATIKVGGIGPMTGAAAVYGQAVKNGAQLAVDEINAAGGVNGINLELNFQDDENDAEKAVNAYNTLKDWGMQMLMGTVTSTPCVAVSEKAKEDNMFLLTPSGSATECVQYDNAFRVCFSDPNQGTASAKYVGENALAQKVAVIYDSSDVYSSGIYQKFSEEAENQPFEVVAAEAFTADSRTDFSVQLQSAKDAGADMVFLPIYYTEASLILTQANTMGYAPAFFGCDGLDGILSVENFDTALAENVMLLTPFAADATDDLTVKFVKAYKDSFKDTPNQFAADAYDAIYAMKAAIEKGGVTVDMEASAICDLMKTAMTEITVDGLTGNGMTWTADGESNKEAKAVKIVKGVYTAM